MLFSSTIPIAVLIRSLLSSDGRARSGDLLHQLRQKGIQVPRNMEPQARPFVDDRKTPTPPGPAARPGAPCPRRTSPGRRACRCAAGRGWSPAPAPGGLRGRRQLLRLRRVRDVRLPHGAVPPAGGPGHHRLSSDGRARSGDLLHHAVDAGVDVDGQALRRLGQQLAPAHRVPGGLHRDGGLEGESRGGECVVDTLLLPNVHPQLIPAISMATQTPPLGPKLSVKTLMYVPPLSFLF